MKKMLVIAAIFLSLTLCGCSSTNSASTVDNSLTDEERQDFLFEIRNWTEVDLWNNGFCDLSWYYGRGTNSTGGSLDAEFTITTLSRAIEKGMTEYRPFIEGLEEDYPYLLEYFDMMMTEASSLIETASTYGDSTPKPFDVGIFEQYNAAFEEELGQVISDVLDSGD